MPNTFRILKPIQKSSKHVGVFRNTGANAFAKHQMRLAYEDKRDLCCIIPPVAGRPVQRTVNGLIGWDVRTKKVSGSVGQSCFRMNSEDTLPVSHDAYDDYGDDRFSPGISGRMSLNCHVDLDSLWKVHWKDRRTVETRSRAGLFAWRGVLCGIARMSYLPVFPANHDLQCLNYLGRNCIMDFSAGETLSPSESDLTDPNGPYVVPVDLLIGNAGGPWRHCPHPTLIQLARLGRLLLVSDTGGPWREFAVIRPRREAAPGYPCWHMWDIVIN